MTDTEPPIDIGEIVVRGQRRSSRGPTMFRMTGVTISLLCACLSARASHAQTQLPSSAIMQPRVASGTATAPEGARFIGGYSSPGGNERYVVEFFAVRDAEDRSPEGVPYASIAMARRSIENDTGSMIVAWIDGRTCGAVYGVLDEFERLTPPTFSIPAWRPAPSGATPLGGVPLRVHPQVVSVWGYARQADGAPMSMMLSGTDGLIDQWVRYAEEQLDACWSAQQPVYSRY